MGYFVIGTAGHIDHGKTSLVKALTGIDTDRLKEEKERGITIETGYAYLKVPEKNLTIGIVDVPGHEKFIKNMVSGIYGIDVLMLIIAADESVMPQTVEHFEICKLLGIKRGFVVITKIDLVDKDILEIVKEDVKELIKDSFLENSPIFCVSSVTKEGIEELKKYIIQLAMKISSEKPISSIFRLPVDRVFTLKGFGTIVTGTTLSGKIKVGDNVIIYPENLTSRVRNIQVHNSPVNEAKAGQRTALNLQGIEKDEIHRGSIVAQIGYFSLEEIIYCELYYLESNRKPLKSRRNVKFHIGTEAIPAEVSFLEKKEVLPGEKLYAIFKLSKPTIALNGDKFIIRSFDDKFTLGGGIVLYSTSKRDKKINEYLEKLSSENLIDKIEAILIISQNHFVSINELLGKISAQKENILNAVNQLKVKGKIIEIDKKIYIHSNVYQELKERAIKIIENFHKSNPELFGISKEELKTKIDKNLDQKLFNYLIESLLNEGKISIEDEYVKLRKFSVSLSSKQKEQLTKIEEIIRQGGIKPPTFKEIVKLLEINEKTVNILLSILTKEGKIVKISPEIYMDKNLYEKIKDQLIKFLEEKGEISVKEFKQIANTSRKYLIPLLEHFDSIKLTMRVGDKRVLRK